MGIFYGSLNHTTSGRKKKTYRRTKSVKQGVSTNITKSYRRETPEYRSASDTTGVAVRVEPIQYTGSFVKGIGTMHKSNAIPIVDEEHMKDIARMRR